MQLLCLVKVPNRRKHHTGQMKEKEKILNKEEGEMEGGMKVGRKDCEILKKELGGKIRRKLLN